MGDIYFVTITVILHFRTLGIPHSSTGISCLFYLCYQDTLFKKNKALLSYWVPCLLGTHLEKNWVFSVGLVKVQLQAS